MPLGAGRQGRHPDFGGAQAKRDLDRGRVDPADGVVEREPAEDPDAGDDLLDQVGAVGRQGDVRLDQHRPHAARRGRPRHAEVVQLAWPHVGRGVDVEVDDAAQIDAIDVQLAGHDCRATEPAPAALRASIASAAVADGPRKPSIDEMVRRVRAKVPISSGSSEARVQSRSRIGR